MPDESVNCVVTSPPYWGLRDYGCYGQLGLEKTPEEFVQKMVEVFREVRRVLRSDGTLWLNLGDSYASAPTHGDPAKASTLQGGKTSQNESRNRPNKIVGQLKPKDMVGTPWRVALSLQADGWFLRQDIIWHKPNPMPESCKDRCTKAHEYLFLLSKSARYHYDQEAIKEPVGLKGNANGFRGGAYVNGNIDNATMGNRTQVGNQRVPAGWDTGPGSHGESLKGRYSGKHSHADDQAGGKRILDSLKRARENGGSHDQPFGTHRNKRSVWTIATTPYKGAHFATFPPKLIEPCILAGCPKGGTVLDPFGGSGTTAFVANAYGRKAILCELNPDNIPLIGDRLGMCYQDETEPETNTQMELFA